jgi:hypothetical protein
MYVEATLESSGVHPNLLAEIEGRPAPPSGGLRWMARLTGPLGHHFTAASFAETAEVILERAHAIGYCDKPTVRWRIVLASHSSMGGLELEHRTDLKALLDEVREFIEARGIEAPQRPAPQIEQGPAYVIPPEHRRLPRGSRRTDQHE